jgi:pSer/pThr/pTyr-binding forkhead associated (FHA) protein
VLHVHRSATIGRAEGADLQLGDDCVSRKHAQFNVIAADQIPFVTLTDLNSANGTFVNHVRMLSEQRLAVGDLIELGNSRVELRAID